MNEKRGSAMPEIWGKCPGKGSANKKTWKFGISERRRER